ncbi:alpha-1-antitrypsin precursor [Gallus gallus]|jgi:serine protease inhibitor|uniref:Serpin family A member 1 n=2 Tax=Gallus gallus TaxID=9031 RepID=A0A8V0Z1E6_CHICK|nr:alpha-1-antitrypsin precursor [Gallus gallus]
MKSALYLCLFLTGLQVQALPKPNHSNKHKEERPHSLGDHPHVEHKNLAHMKIAPSNAEFAFRFYKQVTEAGGNKNIFFSPLSLSTAFAMLSLGARSNTLSQLHKCLTFNLTEMEEQEIHEGFQRLLQLLNDSQRDIQLNMGNTLFIDERLKLQQKFLDDVTNFYYSEAVSMDFQNSEHAKEEINNYIKAKTHGKFLDLLDSIGKDVVMILTNYVYFKGYWEEPFESYNTRDDDFFVDAEHSVKVKMMYKNTYYNIHRDEQLSCWVVEIPYRGNAAAFFVLPDEGSMNQVEDALLQDTVSNWSQSLEGRSIDLYLPKFSISGSYDVKKLFLKMGVTDMFSNNADFSGVAKNTLLKVSRAIHKAKLNVNENGTEAAAVTMVEMKVFSAMIDPLEIKFNRPFVMMIFDKITNSILFMGKVVNPVAKED